MTQTLSPAAAGPRRTQVLRNLRDANGARSIAARSRRPVVGSSGGIHFIPIAFPADELAQRVQRIETLLAIELGARERAAQGGPRGLDTDRLTAVADWVAAQFGTTRAAISHGRRSEVVWLRMLAVYLQRATLNVTLQAVADFWGMADHTIPAHNVRRVVERMETEPAFRAQVQRLHAALSAQAKGGV